MLRFAVSNLLRRPLRTGLTLFGLSASVALLACLLACGAGYQAGLSRELNGMGMQLMVVPLGCPYDAAARVLKGRALDVSLPADALQAVRRDAAVAIAAPVYSAALPRPDEGRTDLWVGIDEATPALKPWWRMTPGSHWFSGAGSVILGAEAAETEMRRPGDRFLSPETNTALTVSGTLERSGTSDDSLFFVPLATAQRMFHGPGRLTAIAVRLKDPTQIGPTAARLQRIKGAQVVTLSEMMGTFLNLTGAARTLVLAIGLVALTISALGIFNTMMAAVVERTPELGVLRAVGMTRFSVFRLMATEALLLAGAGGLLGLGLALGLGPGIEALVRPFLPLAPDGGLFRLSASTVGDCAALTLLVGLAAGLYPAWQAGRLSPAAALRTEAL